MTWIAFAAYFLVTVTVHEFGHAAAAEALGLPWRPTLTWHGPGIVIGNDDIELRPWQIRVTCAAGPLANALVAVAAFELGAGLLFLMCAEMTVINLLPFPRSDGRRILKAGV